jgi:uncharacterized RDD family membrane protein YckC
MSTASPKSASVAAGLPERAAARAIDMLLLAGVNVGLGMVMGFGYDWLVIGAAIVPAYFAVLDVTAGTTLGKLAMGLRVVGPGGGRPTWQQALVRESFTALGAIPFVGPLLALASWIWISMSIRSSPTRQGKHDEFAGGTRVIRVRA